MKTLTRRRAVESFNAKGEAVVSGQGDEECAVMYLTVGDGSSPSDPTEASHDASISGRSGFVETGVKIATGNDAYVKAVAADLAGNLGPVTETQQSRRLGPNHQDTTDRSVTGTTSPTVLETVTIPADTLGTRGGLKLDLIFDFDGTNSNKAVGIRLNGGSTLVSGNAAASYGNFAWVEVILFNAASTSAQEVFLKYADSSGAVSVQQNTASEDTTSDLDVEIVGNLNNASDTITLITSYSRLLGTD